MSTGTSLENYNIMCILMTGKPVTIINNGNNYYDNDNRLSKTGLTLRVINGQQINTTTNYFSVSFFFHKV